MLESVVVLRHASAGDPTAWSHDDLTRPLDPAGLADAMELVGALETWPIDEIWTSPAVRCQHSVAALAASRRVPVIAADWLRLGADERLIRTGLRKVGPAALLCTHREVIPDLLAVLGYAPSQPARFERPVLDKGAALGLRFRDTTVNVERIQPHRPAPVA